MHQVFGGLAERVGEAARFAHQGRPRLVGHVHPLVGIGGDGVGAVHAREKRPEPRREHGQASIGPVGVEPEALAPAEIGDLAQGIDAARVHRARVAHDDRRVQARLPVRGHGLAQEVHADAERIVGRDLAELAQADAEQVHRLVHAIVDLIGGVDDHARQGAQALLAHVARGFRAARRGQGREVRHGSARGQDALGALWETEDLRQPPHDQRLHVDRGVVAAPAVGIHGRGEIVGHGAQGIGGGVDEGEEPRVGVAEGVGQDPLAHEGQHVVGGATVAGQWLFEERRLGADLAEHRAVEQARAMLGHRVRSAIAEPPDFVGGEVELVHAQSRYDEPAL